MQVNVKLHSPAVLPVHPCKISLGETHHSNYIYGRTHDQILPWDIVITAELQCTYTASKIILSWTNYRRPHWI